MSGSVDVVVIGAGPSGLTTALEAASAGRRVLIVEQRAYVDRSPDIRFQAVILDRQTLANLHHLNVDLSCVIPSAVALSLDTLGRCVGTVAYPDFSKAKPLPSSSAMTHLTGRRDIVGVAVIGQIEEALRQACERHPLIAIHYSSRLLHLSERQDAVILDIRSEIGVRSIRAGLVAVCDGARSHERGTLQLLGVTKKPTAPEVETLIVSLATPLAAGELRFRAMADDISSYSTVFGLGSSSILYASLGPELPEQLNLDDLARHATHRMGLEYIPSRAPIRIRQQVKIADQFVVGQRLFVIGDAAFSGTAALGLYFNRGVSDARAFGELCASECMQSYVTRRDHFAQRRLEWATFGILAEESIIGLTFNQNLVPANNPVPDHLLAVLPRWAFRWKVKRGGLLRYCLVNYVDSAATAALSLERLGARAGLPVVERSASWARARWVNAQRLLE